MIAFANRKSRRSFDDAPIAGLRIQEYWHSDVPPSGSEQEITFYHSEVYEFDDIQDFATLVLLFSWEDSVTESARSTLELGTLRAIDTHAFRSHWNSCAGKVNAGYLTLPELEDAFAVSDDWNDKFYVARGKNNYYGVCWSTTA